MSEQMCRTVNPATLKLFESVRQSVHQRAAITINYFSHHISKYVIYLNYKFKFFKKKWKFCTKTAAV